MQPSHSNHIFPSLEGIRKGLSVALGRHRGLVVRAWLAHGSLLFSTIVFGIVPFGIAPTCMA